MGEMTGGRRHACVMRYDMGIAGVMGHSISYRENARFREMYT